MLIPRPLSKCTGECLLRLYAHFISIYTPQLTGIFISPNNLFLSQWKSPEEQVGPDGTAIGELTEKVDIYALGNLFFRFATDKSPWREIADDSHAKLTPEQKASIAHAKVNEGKMPMVPDETLKLKNPYIDVLLEAMEMCYRFKPEDRPTARQVAEFLEKRKKEVDDSLVEFGRYPKQMK